MDIQDYNPLSSIENYSKNLTVSQVVKFFERQNIIFTKTMIQHYVKINLIPNPTNNRFYERRHLMMLSIIYFLKSSISLDEIKLLFENHYDNIEYLYDDFLASINKNYAIISNIYKENNPLLDFMVVCGLSKNLLQSFHSTL